MLKPALVLLAALAFAGAAIAAEPDPDAAAGASAIAGKSSLLTPEDQTKLRDAGQQTREVVQAEAARLRELTKALKPTPEQIAQLRALVNEELNSPKVKKLTQDLQNLDRDLKPRRRDPAARDAYADDPDQTAP